MATIDDKVVAMSFDNRGFEAGATKTLGTLERLKQALNFTGAGKGLNEISASAGKVDLSHISNSVDAIRSKFSALSIAAIAAFATIVSRAVTAGGQLVKSLTLDPIMAGFREYETKMKSIQTILANTSSAGTKLSDVNAVLNDLNRYADQTIYNFEEMTRNIGTFTAAGVDLDRAAASIKGIANLAALSGSNSQQASVAMYQLSQAISAGRVGLQDWNSVVNAGMGGAIFQRALAQTAVHMGALDKNALKLSGSMKNVKINGLSFRESIMAKPGQQSWLTGDVLTKTLAQLSGNLTDAQLKAEGYTDAEIKAIQQQAKMALNAATQVKTLSQLMETTREAIQSGWAETFEIIVGNFGQAKTLFTSLGNAIGGMVQRSAKARNDLLKDWASLSGRQTLIDGITAGLKNLALIIKPIKEAFRDIFPAKTGLQLYTFTEQFRQFMVSLKPSVQTIDNLHRTFEGLFALLDIGKQIVSGIFTAIGHMFGAVGAGSGGFLKLTAAIGDFLVTLNGAFKSSNTIGGFFSALGDVLAVPIRMLSKLAAAIANAFSGLGNVNLGLGQFEGNLNSVLTPLEAFIHGVGEAFVNLGDVISNAFQNINWGLVLDTIKVGLLGGIFLLFRNFFKGANLNDLAGGFLDNISSPFTALTSQMTVMQNQVKAKTLLEIAAAIGILSLSLVALSTVDPKRLSGALSAMAVGFAELLGSMKVLMSISTSKGFLKVPIIAGSLVILAAAIGVLTISVKAMAGLDWNGLAKGLVGVGGLLAAITIASGPLSKNSAGMITAGVGITAIAIAMRILANAVAAFAKMSWESLAKGLSSVGVSLSIIATTMRFFPKGLAVSGAGLIIVAGALKLLASAVGQFGSMDLVGIGKGVAAIGASLIVIAGAMRVMPKGMVAQAAALGLVALAMRGLASSLDILGGMSITQLAKGVGTLGASLGVLAVGLKAMSGSLAGAAALAVAATGLRLLAPALVMLGKQSWGAIVKGMITLGAAIGTLAVAGVALGGVAPAMMAFAVAMLALGGALALAGAGVAAIGIGLSAVATAGSASVAILIKAIEGVLTTIPLAAEKFAQGLVLMVAEIGKAAPQMINSLANILIALSNSVILAAPKLAQAFSVLLVSAVRVLTNNSPMLVAAGLKLLMDLLTGISNNISRITTIAADIVIKFLNTLASKAGQLVTAGLNILVKVLEGVGNNVGRVVTAGANIIVRFLEGFGKNIKNVVVAAAGVIVKVVEGLGQGLKNIVNAGANAIVQFLKGVGSKVEDVVTAATGIAVRFINAVAKGVLALAKAIADALQKEADELPPLVKGATRAMVNLAGSIGLAIVEGILAGLGDIAGKVWAKLKGGLMAPLNWALNLIKGHSPSKVWMVVGKSMVDGVTVGISDTTPNAVKAAAGMANTLIGAIKSIFGIRSPSTVMEQIGRYVGQGFAEGLKGSGNEINSAFQTLGNRLASYISTLRETIQTEKDKLDKMLAQKKPDWDAIGDARKELKANQELLTQAIAGHDLLTKHLKDEKAELIDLSNRYQNISQRLKDAKQALIDAKQAKEDAFASFFETYSKLPDIDTQLAPADQLGSYLLGLLNQANALPDFIKLTDKLKAMGLNKNTYQQLLEMGPMALPFAQEIEKGGPVIIEIINKLEAKVVSGAKKLAGISAKEFKQAGIDSAEALVKGLQSQETKIEAQMTTIGKKMVKALKDELKQKSPSRVFIDIGHQTAAGLILGLGDSSGLVARAATGLGDSALEALKESLKKASTSVADEVGLNPVITPVLDLSTVETDAQRLNRLLNVVPITAATSYGQASSISGPVAPQTPEEIMAAFRPNVTFEQNNYSPEALSDVEIYRQTRNQLSLAKSALGL